MSTLPTFTEALESSEAEYRRIDLDELTALGIYSKPIEYYLLGTYPPLKAMYPIDAAEVFAGATGKYSIYAHIPFCQQYCSFCHFAKEINAAAPRVSRYVDALLREIQLVTAELPARGAADTIYFGGGTPSLLSAHDLRRIHTSLGERFDLATDTETTLELHPNLIRVPGFSDRLRELTALGVNRWVCGVQSMDDAVLSKLNRGHSAQDVYALLRMLAEQQLRNLSLDLIFGLPYQTLENWYASLRSLLEAGVEKFNVYPLMFKISDPITRHYQQNPEIFPSGRERLIMHFMADRMLTEAGFERGPVFFYSRLGRHSRQQEKKFECVEDVNLLPFGVSCFGYVGHTQYHNITEMNGYMQAVEQGCIPVWRGYTLAAEERRRRAIMFAIRSRGVVRREYAARYGVDPLEAYPAEFRTLIDNGLVEEVDGVLQLTGLGVAFADGVGEMFVSALVREQCSTTSATIQSRNSALERFDFSGIARRNAELLDLDAE